MPKSTALHTNLSRATLKNPLVRRDFDALREYPSNSHLAAVGRRLRRFVYLASPSLTQSDRRNGNQQDREKVPLKTSYDQVSPVLLGQESFESMLRKDKADKASVMERQKRLLEDRYDLAPRVDARVPMSPGGEAGLPIGPTAKLPSGMTWEKLARMSAEDIREQNAFPKGYLPLPHPHHEVGGMVFPQVEVKLLPRRSSASTWISICPNTSSRNSRRPFI